MLNKFYRGACGTILGALVCAAPAAAAQYSYLEPGYTQEIYTGPIATGWGPGYAWSSGGNLILRGSGTLYEYSLAASGVYNGTAVHTYTPHAVAGLPGCGYGMTNGNDGFVYANTCGGLAKIDLSSWTATMVTAAGGYYGIDTLPDGRIVYADGSSGIHIYNPSSTLDTLIYSSPTFIDGLATAPTGEILLAALGSSGVTVINSTGAVLNTAWGLAHSPDGMAFGGAGSGVVYGNNTDGTITRLNFAGPGYTGAVTETVFASGGVYGDLAAVGPGCDFYVSQWGGAHWNDGTTTGDPVVVRIAAASGCGFTGGGTVPEPGTMALLGMGLGVLAWRRKLLG